MEQEPQAGCTDKMAKYKVERQIGRGEFGKALLVTDRETGQQHVLKKISLARQSQWQRSSSIQEKELVRGAVNPLSTTIPAAAPPHGAARALPHAPPPTPVTPRPAGRVPGPSLHCAARGKLVSAVGLLALQPVAGARRAPSARAAPTPCPRRVHQGHAVHIVSRFCEKGDLGSLVEKCKKKVGCRRCLGCLRVGTAAPGNGATSCALPEPS
jgi:serine/threonine protein kinase